MQKNSRHLEKPEEDFQPSAIPVDADGGPTPGYGVGQPTPAPPRTPAHFVCLRGPCRNYWHLVTMAQEGNPASTWADLNIPEPRLHSHTCLVQPGYETEFADDTVFECSKWDPYTKTELVQITSRREAYYRHHPEHRPTPLPSRARRLWRWLGDALMPWRASPHDQLAAPQEPLTEDNEDDA